MNQPAVLCIGAGPLQVPLLREAKALGLYVIATDGNPNAPGFDIADEGIVLDTYDFDSHALWANTLANDTPGIRLLGVVTAGADVAPTVAHAAAAAQVPGIPVAVAELSHDKLLVRRAVANAGLSVYQPRFIGWENDYGAPEVVSPSFDTHTALLIPYPCVIKPRQQRASRGITLVDTEEKILLAIQKAQLYGESFLVEQQLLGTEHSVEAILYDKNLLWFNVVDRYFTYDHGIPIEIGHVNPTNLSLLQQQQLELMLRLVAGALGVTWGPLKMDVIWTQDGPKLLEATCRMSGGWDCQRTSPLTGRYPLRTLLQVTCQLPLEPILAPDGYAACAAILPTKEGVLGRLPSHCDRPPEPSLDTIVDDIIWNVQPGDRIQAPEHCAQRPGFVMTWANSYEDAWRGAQEAAAALAAGMEIT